MESIIVFGNGITMDTYNPNKYAFHKIEKNYDSVDFYITNSQHENALILSSKHYPDLVADMENNNDQEISINGKRYLDKILIIEKQNVTFPPEEYLENIVLFNSFCDYIYKLFWHYHRCSSIINSTKSGINAFSQLLYAKKKKPIIISLNYDLTIEKHLKSNKIDFNYFGFNKKIENEIEIFKPHGSINFMSNLNNPNDHAFGNNSPFYPFTNKNLKDKNPIRYRCESIYPDKKIGIINENETPMYTVEIVPPGCSNLLREETDKNYLIPWAKYIYESIFNKIDNKKNLIFIGLSFWQEDLWELIQYIKEFLKNNKLGKIFIIRIEKNNNDIKKIFEQNSIDVSKIKFINGKFKDTYKEISDLL